MTAPGSNPLARPRTGTDDADQQADDRRRSTIPTISGLTPGSTFGKSCSPIAV